MRRSLACTDTNDLGDGVGDLFNGRALQEGEHMPDTLREGRVMGVHPGVDRAVVEAALEPLVLAAIDPDMKVIVMRC